MSSTPNSATAMLIVDTGPLVAYLNRNDPDHGRCAALLESRTDDLLVTPYVVTEACYLVGKYVGADAEINLVEALAGGDLSQADIAASDPIRIIRAASVRLASCSRRRGGSDGRRIGGERGGLVQPHSRDLSTSTSHPGRHGSKPCSTSQRTALRLRNDHHARITSKSTPVP